MTAIKLDKDDLNKIIEHVTDDIKETDLISLFERQEGYKEIPHYEVYLDIDLQGLGDCDVYIDIALHISREGQFYKFGDYWTPPDWSDGVITNVEYVINGIDIYGDEDSYTVAGLDKRTIDVT